MRREVYLLCKCIEKMYAKEMMEHGGIFFNHPIAWIKKGEDGVVGQGDKLEGVYAEDTEDNHNIRTDYESVDDDKGKSYLHSKSIVNNWLCSCFYSVSDWTLTKKEDGTLKSEMNQNYISAFNKGHKQEPLQELSDDEKMATVVITDPKAFLNRIKQHFEVKHQLVDNKDYFMDLVTYRNDEEEFKPINEPPYELFSKGAEFLVQQEYRIVLNAESDKVKAMLKGGQKIFIGQINDCAYLKPFFYDGATIAVDLVNSKLHISRWEGLSERPLHMWKFEHLATILLSILNWEIKCILDGREVSGIYLKKEIDKVLMKKYRIIVDYNKYSKGTESLTFLNPRGMDPETIMKNENKDQYHYLRNRTEEFTSPIFERFGINKPSGFEWYWPLVFQDKITSPIVAKKGISK